MAAIKNISALIHQQLRGALLWTAGFSDAERRQPYVDLLMSKLPAEPEESEERSRLIQWVKESPDLPDGFRATLLDHTALTGS